ncbi:IPT/TIG domain-containing protein [Bacillota bacterium LX-D]|nr:IPT/TIG domain-containing protein [Bacillota bacterium LX-D]
MEIKKIFLKLFLFSLFLACIFNIQTVVWAASSPKIFSIVDGNGDSAIASAVGGMEIIINGEEFQNDPGTKVLINGQFATIETITTNSITVIVPAFKEVFTSTDQKGVDVEVQNADKSSTVLLGTDPKAFKYKKSVPQITAIDPLVGNIGSVVTVSTNDEIYSSGAKVLFGSTVAKINALDTVNNTITVVVPGGNGDVAVTIKNPDGGQYTFADKFSYQLVPQISSVTPAYGPHNKNTQIVITGSNFADNAKVFFADQEVAPLSVSSTKIVVETPIWSSTTTFPAAVDIKVENPASDGTSDSTWATKTDGFTFTNAPEISSVVDKAGDSVIASAVGGMEIKINGQEFQNDPATKVLIDGQSATIETITPETITAIVPAFKGVFTNTDQIGVDVEVQNADKSSTVLLGTDSKAFKYKKSTPQITAINPIIGNKGSIVTINTNDEIYSSGVQVLFGSAPAKISALDTVNNTNTVTVPEGSGDVNVVIKNPDGGQCTFTKFTYKILPTIESVTPNSGNKGTIVRVIGSNFSVNRKVYFNGELASEIVQGDGEFPADIEPEDYDQSKLIVVKVPEGMPGTANVKVVNDDNPGLFCEGPYFQYVSAKSQPEITTITPNVGPLKGGTKVTIEGKDFRTILNENPQVLFGDKEATVLEVYPDKIIVNSPSSLSTGKKGVKIINPDGGETEDYNPGDASDKKFFWYNQTFWINHITPQKGPQSGSTAVTIQGSNFPTVKEQITILFGDVAIYGNEDAENKITIRDSQNIDVITPPGYIPLGESESIVDVKIIKTSTENGLTIIEEAVSPEQYTYTKTIQDPIIVGIKSPDTGKAIGPRAGGTKVYLYAQNLTSGVQVYFGTSKELLGINGQGLLIEKLDSTNNKEEYEKVVEEYNVANNDPIYKITGILPAMDVAGSYDVIVNQDGGSAVLRNGFVFKDTSMSVFNITPDSGTVAGKQEVKIYGLNFNESAETPDVFFIDETDPTKPQRYQAPKESVKVVQVGNSEQPIITALTPSNLKPGKMRVVVKNIFGETTDLVYYEFLWTNTDWIPEITYVYNAEQDSDQLDKTISKGPVQGGTKIIIEGNNLLSKAKVLVGGQPATNITYESSNKIIATTPACTGSPGYKEVTVVNNIDGQDYSGAKEDAFFYYSNPIIDENGLYPQKASIYGGNIIKIIGQDFYEGIKVSISDQTDSTEYKEVETKFVDNNTVLFRVPQQTTTPYDPEIKVNIKVENADSKINDQETGGGVYVLKDVALYKTPSKEIKDLKIFPTSGSVLGGTPFRITGENLDLDAVVYFGWEEATNVVLLNNHTELHGVTPPNAEGKYDVTVSNVEDASTFIITDGFVFKTQKSKPEINAVFPAVGPKLVKTKIKIAGKDFLKGATVYIGTALATDVDVIDNQTITAYTPANDVGEYDVTVVNTDSSSATLTKGFRYTNPASNPQIYLITPNKVVTTGGTIVQISGKDFRKDVQVFIDGIEVDLYDFDESQGLIWVKTPAHVPGQVDVTVLNSDGGLAVYGDFTYVVPQSTPIIESVTPAKGNVAGGTQVVIIGNDFRTGCKVFFGGNAATIVGTVKYNQLTVLTPAGKAGKVSVSVINDPDIGSFTLDNAFEYTVTQPTITSVTPSQGTYLGGTLVTITGEQFLTGAQVYIGNVEAAVQSLTEKQITILTGASGTQQSPVLGYKDVKVVNPDGSSAVLQNGFRYLYPDSSPEITSLSAYQGSTLGGMPLTIYGKDFREGMTVVIGGIDAPVLKLNEVVSGECSVIVQTPAHDPGAVKVIVINSDGASAVSPTDFTYQEPLSYPTVKSVTPAKGPTVGGTEVTISGNYFKSGVSVYFGVNKCPSTDVTFIDYKTIKCITPAGEAGAVDVLVVNPDLGQAFLKSGFTYIQVNNPTLTSVTPSQGPAHGGTAIAIQGKDFAEGAIVYLGGTQAENIVFVDSTALTAVTPAGDPGRADVKVVNPDGGYAILEDGFYYRGIPGTPGELQAWAEDYETIKLSWNLEDDAAVNYYEIFISEDDDDDDYRFLDQTKKTTYYATKLEPDTRYYFKVRAVNEIGASILSLEDDARTDDDAPDDYGEIDAPAKQIITINQDNVVVTIPSKKALSSEGYSIDLGNEKYNKPVRTIKFNAEALNNANYSIHIDSGNLQISLTPSSLLPPGLEDNADLEDATVILTIADLGQQGGEEVLRSLPKNTKLLTDAYEISWASQANKRTVTQEVFYGSVTLSMKYNSFYLPSGKRAGIYTYQAATGKWQKAAALQDASNSTLRLNLTKPGKFVVVSY